jgi:hypothetical protein
LHKAASERPESDRDQEKLTEKRRKEKKLKKSKKVFIQPEKGGYFSGKRYMSRGNPEKRWQLEGRSEPEEEEYLFNWAAWHIDSRQDIRSKFF